jgi:Transposase, Mutator family
VLAVGDGALGFWSALREVFGETREQRCWFHKTANILAALPKSAHPGAKKALAEIWNAEDKQHALDAAFATVPAPHPSHQGPGSRAAGVAMAFTAQARWRAGQCTPPGRLVRVGARFENGNLLERPGEPGGDQQAA